MGTGTKYWKPIFLQESVTPFNPIEYQSESIGNYMYQKEAYLLLHLAVPSAISYIHIVHFETMVLRWPPHLLSV